MGNCLSNSLVTWQNVKSKMKTKKQSFTHRLHGHGCPSLIFLRVISLHAFAIEDVEMWSVYTGRIDAWKYTQQFMLIENDLCELNWSPVLQKTRYHPVPTNLCPLTHHNYTCGLGHSYVFHKEFWGCCKWNLHFLGKVQKLYRSPILMWCKVLDWNVSGKTTQPSCPWDAQCKRVGSGSATFKQRWPKVEGYLRSYIYKRYSFNALSSFGIKAPWRPYFRISACLTIAMIS